MVALNCVHKDMIEASERYRREAEAKVAELESELRGATLRYNELTAQLDAVTKQTYESLSELAKQAVARKSKEDGA